MKDKRLQLQDVAMHARLCQIRDSWTSADRRHRAEEGRQRREEFVRLILKDEFDDSELNDITIDEMRPRPSLKRGAMTPSHQPISKDAKRLGA